MNFVEFTFKAPFFSRRKWKLYRAEYKLEALMNPLCATSKWICVEKAWISVVHCLFPFVLNKPTKSWRDGIQYGYYQIKSKGFVYPCHVCHYISFTLNDNLTENTQVLTNTFKAVAVQWRYCTGGTARLFRYARSPRCLTRFLDLTAQPPNILTAPRNGHWLTNQVTNSLTDKPSHRLPAYERLSDLLTYRPTN